MFQRLATPLLLFATVMATATPAAGVLEGVLSTYMFPEGPPPEVTMVQDEVAQGVLRYTSLVEELVEIPVSVYGGCNVNFRAHATWVNECFQDLDGGNELVGFCPSQFFEQIFDVDQDAKKFGPGVVTIEVPRQFLNDHLSQAGEEMIGNLAAQTEFSATAWRSVDLRIPVDWNLTYYMQCRRWFLGDAVHAQSWFSPLPLMVTYRGATAIPDLLPPDPNPQSPILPIPVDHLTTQNRIEQAALSILPDPAREPCGYVLSGTFVTSNPTEVGYQLVDHLGARSAAFTVDVDETLVAFVSHEIDFAEDATEPIGFTSPEADPEDPEGPAFADTFLANPTDHIQGFYRIEAFAPHAAQSNIVSYDLDDCSAGAGPRAPVFEATVLGDPETVAEILRRTTRADAYGQD